MKTFVKIKSFMIGALAAGLLTLAGAASASAHCYGPSYGPVWHDTSHWDYHPGGYISHGSHLHYVPGHFDFHSSGHYHW
jgi:hypothetical protein